MFEKELEQLRKLYQQGLYQQPFYADRISNPEVFDSYEKFQSIPLMYKDDVRKTKPFERSSITPKDAYGFFSSSGTTGKRTFYVYSNEDKKVHELFVRDFFGELGVNENDIGGVFAPVDTGVMAHSMLWQFNTMGSSYINCPVPSPENMIEFVETVPITLIATRPSVVCSIAANPDYVRRARQSNVRMTLLGGGFLTEGRRKHIENLWDAKCYGMFGMSEIFGPMAGECSAQAGYHYFDTHIMIEILDPVTYKPVQPGEYGIAVYTTLWEKGFPLLRYWTDDYIAIDQTPCSCGRCWPRMHYKGRMADCIEVNGTYVFPSMLEECLFQHGYSGEYRAIQGNTIKVILEKTDGFTVSRDLKNDIDALFMSDVEIEFADHESLLYDGHAIRFTKDR